MYKKRGLGVILTCFAIGGTFLHAKGESAIDLHLARQYFDEAKALSDRDDGSLWGKPLYGPMMFVDPQSRMIVADRPDAQSKLQPEGDVCVGTLPPEQTIANTAVRFAGDHWTMVVWPPPRDRDSRGLLLIHELWHRIQDDLGFPSTGPANAHLDTANGRIWMRLEWAALRKALQSDGSARIDAIQDALTFRAFRRSMFPDAANEERSLEMHEGLANYTGAAIAGNSASARAQAAIHEIDAGEKKPTYVRSFAYASGPAYGLLLDALDPGWREGLKPTHDFGDLLGKAIGFSPPTDPAPLAQQRSSAFDHKRIAAEETKREENRQEMLAHIRAKLIDGPTLYLPFENMKIQLDPNGVVPLDDLGTVYPTARIVDAWGILTVTDGALINNTWSGVSVAAPINLTATPLTGPGWTLELSDGWRLVPGNNPGSHRLQHKP